MIINEVKKLILEDQKNWRIYLMDFVDYFRRKRDPRMIENHSIWTMKGLMQCFAQLFTICVENYLLMYQIGVYEVPACKQPWFVSEMENLKAITLVETPVEFRVRKIFVLENFLSRV